MSYSLLTPPAALPVTLAEAKEDLKIDDAAQDAIVTAWLAGIVGYTEHLVGRALITQTWRVVHDTFPDAFMVPMPPAQSVTAVRYYDEAGQLQTLAPADYLLDVYKLPGWIVPGPGKAWPMTQAGRINACWADINCGYGTAADVPAAAKLFIRAKLREQFDPAIRPEKDTVQSSFLDRLLDPLMIRQVA